MLSFQARKKEDNYLLPVNKYMSTPTQSKSTYDYSTAMSKPAAMSKPTQTPVYQPFAKLQSVMSSTNKPTYTTPTVNKPGINQAGGAGNDYGPKYTQPQPTAPINKLQQIGVSRQQFVQKQADDEAARQKGIFDIRSKALEAQKPELESGLRNYQNRSNEAIKIQEDQAALTKQNIYDTRGEEMRLNAQTAREGRGRVQNTLAGLNALDSSSTGQLLAKAEGNLTNLQGKALSNRSMEMNQADSDLQNYKIQAGSLVDEEIAKFNQSMRDIAANYDINSLEYQNAVKQAYDKAQESIYSIEEGVANAELDLQKIYDTAYATEDAKNQVAGAGNGKSEIANVINTLMGRDTGAITGVRNPFKFMTGDAQLTKNYYNQLKGLLSLENREKLKGSGAISDYESKVLERAATALGTNLSNEGFKQVLGEIAQAFGAGGQGGMITMQSPDGQTYQVDQAEAQEAMANGWRQV